MHQTSNPKIKPQDVGSERAVLAGICQFGRDAYIDVADIIDTSTFTLESNQAIFKCLREIVKDAEKIDIPSIIAQADQFNLSRLVYEKRDDLEFLRSLFNFPLHLENVRRHAQRIARLEFARKAQSRHVTAYNQLKEVSGSESIDEILNISENPIFELSTELNKGREEDPKLVGHEVDQFIEHLENNPCDNIGIPTPYPILNQVIGGGLRKGAVDLIGARMGIGKSSIAINIGIYTAQTLQIPTLYLDTEMTYEDQMPRILAKLSQVGIGIIERGKYTNVKEKIYQAKEELKNISLFYKGIAGKNFEEILSIIRRWIVKEVKYDENGKINPCLVLYDYFKIMDTGELEKLQEHQAIGFQISRLADFCKQYSFPCLSFVQLNRDGITKETSDILSQSDRLMWMCSSCAVFKPKTSEELVQDGVKNGNRKLFILKHRFGSGLDPGNYINMNFHGETCTITELNTKFDLEKEAENDSGFEIEE